MSDKDGVRDISPETLHINPLTKTPYESINEFTYNLLTPEVRKLYRKNPESLVYGYFGRLVKRDS